MLLQLHIENVAVIELADLSFENGFHVLTGETGAGKSMVIDALNMILGERASKDIIRTGAEKAYVEALFEVQNHELSALLEEAGILFDGELLISKEINLSGKSVCRINGRMVTAAFLRTVGSFLVNLHGQFDNQRLFQPRVHHEYLDQFGNIDFSAYNQAFLRVENIKKELALIDLNDERVKETYERLKFEVEEIEQASLSAEEEDEIRRTLDALEHAEQILRLVEEARTALYESSSGCSAYDEMGKTIRALASAERYDESLSSFSERARQLLPEIKELAVDLSAYVESVSLDQHRIAELHQRLDTIQHLKRKYGNSVEEVLTALSEKKEELDRLENAETRLIALQDEYKQAYGKLIKCADEVSTQRKLSAEILQTEITKHLLDLDMAGVSFVVSLIPQEDFTPAGAETVEFLISTEPGSIPKSLAKIASGGEMSRVMLAIQVVLNEMDAVDTLVFDEIDAGVSGRAAQKIAQKLYQAAAKKQVLCITHLSQLAVMADVHYLIEKNVGESVKTSVQKLDREGRVLELSRILSGSRNTELTRKTAEELLALADEDKKERNA